MWGGGRGGGRGVGLRKGIIYILSIFLRILILSGVFSYLTLLLLFYLSFFPFNCRCFFFIHFSYSSLLPSSHFPIQTKRSSALSDNLFHKIVKSFSQSTPTRSGEYDQDPVTSRSLGQGYGRPLPPQTPRSLLFQPIDGVKWRHHPHARLVIGAAVSVSLATLKAE